METYVCAVITLFISWFVQNPVHGADFCDSNPCQNSGVCEPRGNNGYICKCPVSTLGVNCESINECGSNPCQNGGVCIDDLSMYVCQCKPGFTGINCETDIDECASAPCAYGATCEDGPGLFKCQCKTGFTGSRCDTDIDECALSPCQNDGTCKNLLHGFKCNCRPDYLGTRCEVYNEEYGRRSGLVWTIVAVAVIVILIMVILAVSLPLTMRRQRALDKDSETTERAEDMTPKKKRGRIFTVPGIFRKNDKDTKRPIYFTVTRSSSMELKVDGNMSLKDLRPMEEASQTQKAHAHVKYNMNGTPVNGSFSPAPVNGRIAFSNYDIHTDQSHLTSYKAYQTTVSGNISLVDNSNPTAGSGPYVTNLHVND